MLEAPAPAAKAAEPPLFPGPPSCKQRVKRDSVGGSHVALCGSEAPKKTPREGCKAQRSCRINSPSYHEDEDKHDDDDEDDEGDTDDDDY